MNTKEETTSATNSMFARAHMNSTTRFPLTPTLSPSA